MREAERKESEEREEREEMEEREEREETEEREDTEERGREKRRGEGGDGGEGGKRGKAREPRERDERGRPRVPRSRSCPRARSRTTLCKHLRRNLTGSKFPTVCGSVSSCLWKSSAYISNLMSVLFIILFRRSVSAGGSEGKRALWSHTRDFNDRIHSHL